MFDDELLEDDYIFISPDRNIEIDISSIFEDWDFTVNMGARNE